MFLQAFLFERCTMQKKKKRKKIIGFCLAGKEYACNAGRPCFDCRVQKITWRGDRIPTPVFLSFPGGSDGKESACNAGDLGSIPGLERSPRGGHGNPLQYSCLENPHGQRSLVGYIPWGRKESNMIE